jgi:predicted Zn-dependent protease
MTSRILAFTFLLSIPLLFNGCKSFNLFTVEDDIALGLQVSQQIASDPQQFPILPERGNEEAYRYIRGLTQKILNSGKVKYRNEFAWEVKIIDDDETLNAFCAPGGYIYVYTGLIKYLDSEDDLAGVMGHEIAHAALRHSTRQLTKIYGISALVSIATGKSEPGMLEQLALSLVSLQFSRDHEKEADANSVVYLCETDLNAAGAAEFFKKINQAGGARPPAFLSTHPDPGNRVKNIENKKNELNCQGRATNVREYARIKNLL